MMNNFNDEINPLTDNLNDQPVINETQPEPVSSPTTDAVYANMTPPTPPVQPNVNTQSSGISMRCMRCGTMSTTPFCPNCGLDIKAGLSQAYQYQQNPYQQNYQPQSNPYQPQPNQYPPQYMQYQAPPRKNSVGIALAIIIPVFLVITFIVMLIMTSLTSYNRESITRDDIGFGGSQFGQDKDDKDTDKGGSNKGEPIPNGVSSEEYDQIEKGMSYAQISAIIGGDGILADSGRNIHNEEYYTYGWIGENNNECELYITFIDGKATDIDLNGDL